MLLSFENGFQYPCVRTVAPYTTILVIVQIPAALWATGGVAIVPGKLPLRLASLRALDPACLDLSRVHIGFGKVYLLIKTVRKEKEFCEVQSRRKLYRVV